MTKMNWQRANERDRYLRSLYAENSDAIKPHDDTLYLDNSAHNPLGLVLEDFTGQMPSEATRLKIVKHLIANDKGVRDRCSYEWGQITTNHISSKEFASFANTVLRASLDWPNEKCPVQNLLACSVCFAVLYLHDYNKLVGKDKKAAKLTPEVFRHYQILLHENLIESAKHIESKSFGKRVAAIYAAEILKKGNE